MGRRRRISWSVNWKAGTTAHASRMWHALCIPRATMAKVDLSEVEDVLRKRMKDARKRRERREGKAPVRIVLPEAKRVGKEPTEETVKGDGWLQNRRKEMVDKCSETVRKLQGAEKYVHGSHGVDRAREGKGTHQTSSEHSPEVQWPEESAHVHPRNQTCVQSTAGPSTASEGIHHAQQWGAELHHFIRSAVDGFPSQQMKDLLGSSGGDQFHDGIQARLGGPISAQWEKFAAEFLQETRRDYERAVCTSVLTYSLCIKAGGSCEETGSRRGMDAFRHVFAPSMVESTRCQHRLASKPQDTFDHPSMESRRKALSDRLLVANEKQLSLQRKFQQSILNVQKDDTNAAAEEREQACVLMELESFAAMRRQILNPSCRGSLIQLYRTLFSSMRQVQRERGVLAKTSLTTLTYPFTMEYRRPARE